VRAVLDTNVLVNALLFRGTASRLAPHWQAARLTLVVSTPTLAELARVLAYPKFGRTAEQVQAIIAGGILPFSTRVEPVRDPPTCRDPDDDAFLWCARDGEVDCLATGDSDLLALAPMWCGVRILTVLELLAILEPTTNDG
jgi:putative PIN family toxin of toxin-antitoxin system